MQTLLSWLVLIASIVTIVGVISGRRFVTGLTLMSSWRWAIAASVSVCVSTLVSTPLVRVSSGWKSAAQYFAATMLLTPLVATLGARRPGNSAWQWFVVLPMIVVMQWPAVTQLVSSHGHEAVELGAPSTMGVLVVVMMSAGTLLGTSMTLSAVLYVSAVLCCLLPSSGWLSATSAAPLLSPFLLCAVQLTASRVLISRLAAAQNAEGIVASTDAAWQLYQTLYGLVWARRVLDRVNQFAGREQWTVVLTPEGFRRSDNTRVSSDELAKPLEAFCWVLNRFADQTWIDSYVNKNAGVDASGRGILPNGRQQTPSADHDA